MFGLENVSIDGGTLLFGLWGGISAVAVLVMAACGDSNGTTKKRCCWTRNCKNR